MAINIDMNTTTHPTTAVQQSFALSYLTFKNDLTLHANYKVNNAEVSEDLVSVTFMKTWTYLLKGGKINLMRAFLYHVLNDLITDEYRKKKSVSLDALTDKGFEPIVFTDDYERLSSELDEKAVLKLIDRLPSRYQKIMHMRYVQDLSIGEMAAKTGQTKNALAVQAHRGLEKIKVLYNTEASVYA